MKRCKVTRENGNKKWFHTATDERKELVDKEEQKEEAPAECRA